MHCWFLIDGNIACKNPVGDVQSITADLITAGPDSDIIGLAGSEVLHNAEVDFACKIIVEFDQTGAAAIQIANGVQRPGGTDGVGFAYCRGKLESLFGPGAADATADISFRCDLLRRFHIRVGRAIAAGACSCNACGGSRRLVRDFRVRRRRVRLNGCRHCRNRLCGFRLRLRSVGRLLLPRNYKSPP